MTAPRPAGYKPTTAPVVIETTATETPPPSIEVTATVEQPPTITVDGTIPETKPEAKPEVALPLHLWEMRSGCPGNTDVVYAQGITPKRAVLSLLDVMNQHVNIIHSVITRKNEAGELEHVFSRNCGWPIIVREIAWKEHHPQQSVSPRTMLPEE